MAGQAAAQSAAAAGSSSGRLTRVQAPQRLARQLIEARIAGAFDMGGELISHALGPELRDVIGNAGDGLLALGFRAKAAADVIRHLHQVLRPAVSFTAHGRSYLTSASALFNSVSWVSLNSRKRFCHSEG